MTVDNEISRNDYDPDGVVATFPYNFRIDNASDLVVKEDGVTVVGGYSVTDVGEDAGGDVIFSVPPADGVDVLTLIREVPLTQETAYPTFGPFPAESHEAALDKLTFMCQQIEEKIGRGLRTGSEVLADPSVPDPVAGKRLAWKDDLSGLKNVDSEDQEAAGYAAIAEGFAVDAGDSAALAADSESDAADSVILCQDEVVKCQTEVTNCQDEVVLATAQADAAAASAAAAALYDPTWGPWVTVTVALSGWSVDTVVEERISADGKHVDLRGKLTSLVVLTDAESTIFSNGYPFDVTEPITGFGSGDWMTGVLRLDAFGVAYFHALDGETMPIGTTIRFNNQYSYA